MKSPAELGHSIAANRILLVDPEHTVLVGVECHRFAMALKISSCRRKIIEGALALDKLQMHQPTSRIVNVDEQGALRVSNHQCSDPSIWISSPTQSRRCRGWWTGFKRARRSFHRPAMIIHCRSVSHAR